MFNEFVDNAFGSYAPINLDGRMECILLELGQKAY